MLVSAIQRGWRNPLPLLLFCLTPFAVAAGPETPSLATVKPILDARLAGTPEELRGADQARWAAWSAREDKAIRVRLEQGDLDSMVNLMLLGTSFTKQPRVIIEKVAEASRSGVLRARLDDFVAGIREPGDNERLAFLRALLDRRGVRLDPNRPDAGAFVLGQLDRVLRERLDLAQKAAASRDRASLFSERGVSLDTRITPDFAIDRTLADLQSRKAFGGEIKSVAVIGPGLDFIDKNDDWAFDYYPQQTTQPFSLADSLERLGLVERPRVHVLDISPRVFDHLRRARARAEKGEGYFVQLPKPPGNAGAVPARPLDDYWAVWGGSIGVPAAPLRPSDVSRGLAARAVRVRPDVVQRIDATDLDIVLQRQSMKEDERFDLVIATNILVYYDSFEQALALENIATMLKPGGIFLTNDVLPDVAGGSIRKTGETEVVYDPGDKSAREFVSWYRRR